MKTWAQQLGAIFVPGDGKDFLNFFLIFFLHIIYLCVILNLSGNFLLEEKMEP